MFALLRFGLPWATRASRSPAGAADRHLLLLAAALVPLFAACASTGRSTPPPGVQISGDWTIDRRASEDPLTLIGGSGWRDPRRGRSRFGGGGTIGGGMGPGGGYGPGRMGPGEGGEDGEGRGEGTEGRRRGASDARQAYESAGAVMDGLLHPPRGLRIEQRDTVVHITFDDGAIAIVPTSGREVSVEWGDGATVDASASWKGDALELKRHVGDLVHVEQRVSRAPGTSRLVVVTKASNSAGVKLEYRSEYAPTASAGGSD